MKDQKIAILNSVSKITTPKMAEPITDFLIEEGLEKATVENLSALEGVSESAAERMAATVRLHEELSKTSVRKQSETKPTAVEKFKSAHTTEEKEKIGRDVAELRINAEGSKPMSWRRIREKLGLRNDEFHKVIRLADHYEESMIQRIESFDSWEYSGKIEVLLGFTPTETMMERIEACKPAPKPKEEKPEEVVKSEEVETPAEVETPVEESEDTSEDVDLNDALDNNEGDVELEEEPTEEELIEIAAAMESI